MTIGENAFRNQMTSDALSQKGSIKVNNAYIIDKEAFYNNKYAMAVEITNSEDGATDLQILASAFEQSTNYIYSEPKLTALDKSQDGGTFTDVYDYRHVGISTDSVKTTDKSADLGDDAQRQVMLEKIERLVKHLKSINFNSKTTNILRVNKDVKD